MSRPDQDHVQRTRQAWVRTGLSVIGGGVVVTRLALLDRSWSALAVAGAALGCGVYAIVARSVPATVVAVCCVGVGAFALIVS